MRLSSVSLTSRTNRSAKQLQIARRISEHNDSLVVIDFKFSLPKADASAYKFTIRRDSTQIVSFNNLATIPDTAGNIATAINSCVLNNNTLVLMREADIFYLYNIYTILSDYGKNPGDRLSGTLIKSTGEVDTAIAHIGIYGDSSYQNMISTVYDLLRDTASNPLYPGMLQSITPSDTLKVKLLITAMLGLSLPHNSPAPNSNEAASGIFTNYIQCMDNIVRNGSTIRNGGIGLPRLRNIHTNVLATNKDSVIIDPIYVKNHGTLAEYGQQKEAQKRKNYAFYEGYSRLNVNLAVRPSGSPLVPTASGLMFRISPNIQLYEANLADTFNMFDTAFISGGPSSRRMYEMWATSQGATELSDHVTRVFYGFGKCVTMFCALIKPIWYEPSFFHIAGFILIISGISFRIWTIQTGIKYYNNIEEKGNKHFICTGPYKYL